MCNNLNIHSLVVEMDASMIVNMLCNDNALSRSLLPLVDDSRILLNKIPQYKVQHCFREANRCANVLAKMGAEQAWILFLLIFPLLVLWIKSGRMP